MVVCVVVISVLYAGARARVTVIAHVCHVFVRAHDERPIGKCSCDVIVVVASVTVVVIIIDGTGAFVVGALPATRSIERSKLIVNAAHTARYTRAASA